MDILLHIKQLIIGQKVVFTTKALMEMRADGIIDCMVYEAVLSAPSINKKLRSRNPGTGERETLYVIKGLTYGGLLLYTKGKLSKFQGTEVFYVFISSKKNTD